LEYGAELWHGEISKAWSKKLERLQRALCSAVLQLKGKVATAGMCAELGLRSLANHRRSLKLGYFEKLCSAEEDRLLSLVFRRRHAELQRGGARFSGLRSMRKVLLDAGFSREWNARECAPRDVWLSEVESAVSAQGAAEQRDALLERSTLANYTRLELAPGGKDAAMYLWDRSNRPGTKLMTKARLGHLLLMQNVARVRGWPASKAVCVMCNGGVEDVTHFLLHCKVLAPCRERFVRSLAVSLKSAGLPGRIVLQRVQQGGDACLGVMLGGTTEWSCLAGLDEASFRANCGKANWLACTSAKNFLVAAWRVREAVVGRVKIQGSALLMEPSPRTYAAEVAKQAGSGTEVQFWRWRRYWWQWVPKAAARWVGATRRSGRRGRAAYYVVTRARENGLFYAWRHVQRSMAGIPEAHVKGFMALADALEYARRHGVV
jgi:hypothetical protein